MVQLGVCRGVRFRIAHGFSQGAWPFDCRSYMGDCSAASLGDTFGPGNFGPGNEVWLSLSGVAPERERLCEVF